jgi:hypothetical protein
MSAKARRTDSGEIELVEAPSSFLRELAELALAHSVGSEVERAYRRGDGLQRRRELMEAWATYVAAPTDPIINPTIVVE